jgi:hypothetical protein
MTNSSRSISRPDRMTMFERAIVFRVARGYFFAMAILAVLIFCGGLVVGARGLAKAEIPRPAPPAVPAARPPVDLNAIIAQVDREKQVAPAGSTIEVSSQAGGKISKGKDPEEERFAVAVARLRTAFPDPPYSWDNELEKTCTAPTAFGCLQWGTKVKRIGVAGVLTKLFEGMERAEIIDYIGVVTDLLMRAPVERRLELVGPIIAAERDARHDHRVLLEKHRNKVRELEDKYEADVAAENAKRADWRLMGSYGLGLGFGLLITVSLFLAFLSMERQTRVLEKLVGTKDRLPEDVEHL